LILRTCPRQTEQCAGSFWCAALVKLDTGLERAALLLNEVIQRLNEIGIDKILSLGTLTTGTRDSDGVVPVYSAHGEKPPGTTVPVIATKVAAKPTRKFNYLDVGKPAQPISDFLDDAILPNLTDWVVAKTESSPQP
jgi:hypothetical protein